MPVRGVEVFTFLSFNIIKWQQVEFVLQNEFSTSLLSNARKEKYIFGSTKKKEELFTHFFVQFNICVWRLMAITQTQNPLEGIYFHLLL